MRLALGFSPCPNDCFMFDAIVNRRIDLDGLEFAVHLDDVEGFRGAPNIDSACSGTTLGDYLRGSDLARIPAETIALHDTPALGAAS